jgi:hypothetical protein
MFSSAFIAALQIKKPAYDALQKKYFAAQQIFL